MDKLSPLIAAILVSIVMPFGIMAADISNDTGPEVIKLKMGDLYMNFQHWKHQNSTNYECFHCHNSNGWKIEEWNQKVAHQLCISCHDRIGRGPADCKGCHSSTYTSMQQDDD